MTLQLRDRLVQLARQAGLDAHPRDYPTGTPALVVDGPADADAVGRIYRHLVGGNERLRAADVRGGVAVY